MIGAEIIAYCALTEQSASPFATKLLQIELKGKGGQSGSCIPPENTGDSQDTEGGVLEEIASALLSLQEHQRNAPRGRDITREHLRAPMSPRVIAYRKRGAKEIPIAADVKPSNLGVDMLRKFGTPNIRRTSAKPDSELLR